MGLRKEEELNGCHHSGDDTSDDEGHSLKKSAAKEEGSPKKEEASPEKESHDETSRSSSSSSASSSSSSSSSSTTTSHHHHHNGDNGAQAPGKEEGEVVSPVGRNDVMVESTVVEETEEGVPGTRDEGEDGDSEASDAPVYDKFLVETSLKEDQKTDGKASELDKQESVNDYNVVISETVDGIHDALESKHDAEIAVPEDITAPEKKSEELGAEVEESTMSSHSEEREISGEAHEAAEGKGNGIHEAGKDVVEEQSIEESEFEANGIALEGETGATDLTPEESESKNGQENGGRQSVRELSVELGSPLDHQKRYMRPFMTPSPPKRENSVYKIVMALEGLQVGEKCIHGEIDHGTCHQRYGDRRMSSSPSFSARAHRETSASPKEGDTEVRVSNDEKTEVDSDWSFVQRDSQSGVTTQQSSTVKTETYTDTVVFRRDDGFLPRTPGRSPLSGSQSMRAVFNQADASGSTTPRLKIVHEFPAERTHDDAAAVEGESEVERILRLQETHDLVCPVCRSCITKRVILRKRKRTTVLSTDDQWVSETVQDSDSEENVTEAPDTVVERYEDYGCLGCFTFLFRRERSVQRTQAVEVSRTEDAAASVTTVTQATDQLQTEPVLVVAPPALTDADYSNRCLPIFFTWRRKTTSSTDAEIVAPLLRKEVKDSLSEESKSEEVGARDVPELDDQTRGSSSAAPPSASEILELPAAPGPVEGVQLPVVVVESREDRLCFPFLWRRASKTTTAQPEILQPLLDEEAITDQSEIDQLSLRDTKKSSVVDEQRRTEDFSRIEDDLWMRREVLLEVPVSVPPQEELTAPDSSEAVAEADTSFKTVRVTEAERKVDCLCFPSWSSSETTSEETESSRITNSSQVGSSSEASVIASSTTSKTTVDTSVSSSAEMSLSSPSLKEGVVPVSVPPQEELTAPDSSEAVAEADTSYKTIRVTEAERKVDCLCFPSWSSSETTSEETESSPVTNSSQVGSSSEASVIASSTTSKTTVDTSVSSSAGMSLSSPSLKEGVVAPVAPSTEEREPQRATLNCMDLLIPSYPWGPPGTGSRKEVLERSEEHSGTATEEYSGTATSTQFEFSAADQVVNAGIVTEHVASEGFTKLGSLAKKPQEEISQTAIGSIKQPRSQAKELQGTENGISTMRTEDSRCLPLLLPTISWRRQEAKIGEVLDQSETGEIKTSEQKSSTTSIISQSSETKISNEKKVESKSGEIKSSVTSEQKSPTTSIVSQSSETKIGSKELTFGDIEVSRSQSGQQIEQIHNDFAAEVMEEEEVPLVRRKPLTPSEVEPLPTEENPQVVVQPDDSSLLPEVVERDFIFSQDETRTPELPRVDEEKSREKASWSSCLPSASQDVTVTPSLPPVDVTLDEERRETGSWSCCLPSYTQLASQPKDTVNGEEAVSGGRASESYVHEEVTRETIIDARVTTQTTTTNATESGSIDSIKVDTSVSYVHASVQHDEDAVEGTLHLDDHPTFNLHPAAKLPALEGEPQPLLETTYSTGYAVLAGFLEDEESNAEEDAAINERLAKQVEQLVTEVEQEVSSREEIKRSEAVTEGKVSTVLSEQNIKQEVSPAVTEGKVSTVLSEQNIKQEVSPAVAERTQAQVSVDQEEDRSCCLPSSQWRWGRSKLSSEAAHLREPLLGADYAQSQVSDLPPSKIDTTAQQTGETTITTAVRDREDESCSCLPWSGRRYDLALEAQLREPLLQQDTAASEQQLLRRDSEVDSKSDSSAHVTIEQTHAVTHTTTGPSAERDLPDEERCNCLPWGTRRYSRVDTTVTVTSDDTVIEVEGTDAANTLAAATAAAENAGMMDAHPSESPELLKSVVYGGLDVSLASLGVVASAAGGDAKTRNILALGLANLIFGFIAFYYKIQDMHKESPARFQQSVGPRFWINGPLAMISFLFFGALPVLVFGFSFRELNDYDYKMAATVLASTIAIVFLGCGKVAAKVTELSYRRTLTTLITTGIGAAVAGFYTGEYISMLLAKYGILDE